MASAVKIDGEPLLVNDCQYPSFKNEIRREAESQGMGFGNHGGLCAICLDKIVLQETALVKGCEHAYCVTCILQWATYNPKVICPQCKHPFEFLNVHRSLDGSIHDYMFEESVCLLLRASWFKPITVKAHVDHEDDMEEYYQDEDEDEEDDLDDYYSGSSSLRIGNRRWGDNGYVRAGHQEARPVYRPNPQDSGASSSRKPKKKEAAKATTGPIAQDSGASSSREPKKKEAAKATTGPIAQDSGASSSREPKKKEAAKDTTGRRAKRALKREAADKAAAAKHQQHLARLGRK